MKITDIKKLLASAALKYVSKEEAEYFAAETVEMDIRKPPRKNYNHGTVDDIKSWNGKDQQVLKSIDLPGYTQFDFKGKGPSLKIKEIHDELERKARANGISMISIVNSGGMHTMHLWTQGLAKRGLFALGAWNGGPDAVVPFNGTRGIFGTNPMTYGFPSDTGDVVIDMATSEIPFFKIIGAKADQTPLSENTAVDTDGELTTDPNKAIDEKEVSNLLPMGGNYKGYNINYLMEIMTSALVGARVSSEMSNSYIETEHGGFVIAIAIDMVTDRKKYDASVKSMNEKIRAQKPKKGVEKVQVPGDRNLEKKRGVTDDSDIEIDEEYKNILIELAK
jgi:LDH2 family malate/lactate/ureidoglycolate dehydrogenase